MEENQVSSPQNTSEQPVAENQGTENGQVQQADQPAQPPQRPGGWSIFKTLLVRMFFIYMISSFFRRGSTPAPDQTKEGIVGPGITTTGKNIYYKDMTMDMYVYVSEQLSFTDFNSKESLFWLEEELNYGDWASGFNGDGSYEKSGVITASQNVMNNGSLYIHIYFVKTGKSPNPKDDHHDSTTTVYRSKRLNKYKKRKFHTSVNLLTGTTEAHPDLIKKDNATTVEVLSHWHPNLTINLIEDFTPWQRGSIPAPLDEYIEFHSDGMTYSPILYINDYWNLQQHYMPVNETTPKLNLTLTYSPMSLFKWQMYAAQGMRNKWYSFLGDDFMEESDEDQDSLKTTLVETNPYLLAITIIVSMVHSVFEFLAFKNDIQFWKNKKSLEGMSVRSVFFNVFQSLIVVLYVLDNETNFVVKISVSIGLVIELWKITKVTDIQFDRERKLFGLIPRPTIRDKSTYTESETKKYDILAFKYLSWVLFPLLGAYAVYSVVYNEHKGWYSWVLSILYGFLLMFGFIMMTPQLFINYKLKSVAHLPWRMMTYKALNTFIDDLFAFVIKMPILYRLGCFRDDIVFIIFLYQRWIYKVDKSRVNEFGISGDALEEAEKEKSQQGQVAASSNGQVATEDIPPIEPKPDQEKKDD